MFKIVFCGKINLVKYDLYKFESSVWNFVELKLVCVNEYMLSWYDREVIEVI